MRGAGFIGSSMTAISTSPIALRPSGKSLTSVGNHVATKTFQLRTRQNKMSVYKGWPDKFVIQTREKEIVDLKAKLALTVELVEMVQDNRKMPHFHLDHYERLCCLSERATEVLEKLGENK
jgi:hypothetical protein